MRVAGTRLTVVVSGNVQGVGFRWWAQGQARRLGLDGSAVNRTDGRVEIVAEGPRAACEQLLQALHGHPPGRVSSVNPQWADATGDFDGFRAG